MFKPLNMHLRTAFQATYCRVRDTDTCPKPQKLRRPFLRSSGGVTVRSHFSPSHTDNTQLSLGIYFLKFAHLHKRVLPVSSLSSKAPTGILFCSIPHTRVKLGKTESSLPLLQPLPRIQYLCLPCNHHSGLDRNRDNATQITAGQTDIPPLQTTTRGENEACTIYPHMFLFSLAALAAKISSSTRGRQNQSPICTDDVHEVLPGGHDYVFMHKRTAKRSA